MNSRQKRRNRHAVKMAKVGLRKFDKRMGFLIMQESPLVRWLKKKYADKPLDGGTYIQEPLIYSPEKPLNGVN